ncbi:MAG: sigma-70 family RNA polymerase sigma factor [Clostridia bacterium]|nr:sigma-70 family RNA polymerase sigma factor [Clostridia bacterium]
MINEYIEAHGKRLYGLCLTLTRNHHEADDLYQDTWLRVLKSIKSYDASLPFEPWLTAICLNTYRSSLRRLLKSPIVDFSDAEKKQRLMNAAPTPDNGGDAEVRRAVDALDEKLRLTVILYYFRGFDIKETAKALSVPVGTVKSRLNKARKLLKEVLKGEEYL